MKSVIEVYNDDRHIFNSVVPLAQEISCRVCLGPVGAGGPTCNTCMVTCLYPLLPEALQGCVVPASIALKSSGWHQRLWAYKSWSPWYGTRGHPRYGLTVGCLLWAFYLSQRPALEALAGGAFTVATCVPSTGSGDLHVSQHRLRLAFSAVSDEPVPIRDLLQHRAGEWKPRGVYSRDLFEAGTSPARGERVLLVEDCWVTGATALSAAGQILTLGAESVVILPAARMVNESYWAGDPYVQQCKVAHDLSIWPR